MPILDIGRVVPDQPGRRWVVRAEHLLVSGDAEAALAVCNEGLQAVPDDPGCLLTRARVLHRLHRLEEAMVDVWRVVARDPDRPEARLGLAELLAGTSSPTSAPTPSSVPQPSHISSPSRPGRLGVRPVDSASAMVPWTDDVFGDLEQRLRARAAPPSPDDLTALAELERWLDQLTRVEP